MHKPHFDAGHGGKDSGAIGVVHEEDVNLSIALFCFSAAVRQGWKPTMTRTIDKTIELGSRALTANANGADAFVSLHVDWSGAQGNGFAAITPTNHDAKTSWRMADYLMDELTPLTKYADTGIYADRRGLAVLRGTGMPACLIEVMSVNDKILTQPSFHKEVAEQIIQGMCKFYGVAYVPEGAKAAPKPTPHPKLPMLNRGDRGAMVKVVQKAVGLKPHYVDGVFGKQTEEYVKRFQRRHHLKDDGIVGPNTWKAIKAL